MIWQFSFILVQKTNPYLAVIKSIQPKCTYIIHIYQLRTYNTMRMMYRLFLQTESGDPKRSPLFCAVTAEDRCLNKNGKYFPHLYSPGKKLEE